jgi:DNA-binding NtrC family response regulator
MDTNMKNNTQEAGLILSEGNGDMSVLKETLIRTYLTGNCSTEGIPLKDFIREIEKAMIIRALRISGGSQRIASFVLGIKPTTLNEKIKKMSITDFKRNSAKKNIQQLINELDISAL